MKNRAHKKQPGRKTASRKQRAGVAGRTGLVRFPEVEGKTLEWVELALDDEYSAIELSFADKTALRFDLRTTLSVRPDLADWKTRNRREIKEWPRFYTPLYE